MNYIIDPSVFYWINTLSNISTACIIIGVLCLIAAVSFTIAFVYSSYELDKPQEPEDKEDKWEMNYYYRRLKDYNEEKRKVNIIRNIMIITYCIGSLFFAASIFIPSKNTSVEMLVAKTATFENVNWSVTQIKEVVDYIINAIKTVV